MMQIQIKSLFENYTLEKQDELLSSLFQSSPPEAQVDEFNKQLQKNLKVSMMSIMKKEGYLPHICSLMEVMCTALSLHHIKKSVVIDLLENVLECAGATDMKDVVRVVREQIAMFTDLQPTDLNKLLRIINHLLKRISKTQDFYIRGELQLALTKILTVCHDSGFHSRSQPSKPTPVEKDEGEIFEKFKNTNISEKFYKDFWSIQRFFMDINELNSIQQEQSQKDNAKQANKQIIYFNLKKVDDIMNQTIAYFHKYPPTITNTLETFPLKFMKLPNLFTLQMNDYYFRKCILIQALIFCFSMKYPPSKSIIQLNTDHKSILEAINLNVTKELKKMIEGNGCIIEKFLELLANQKNWIELKDNWKEQKKTFFKEPAQKIKSILGGKADVQQKITEPQLYASVDLKKRGEKISRDVNEKLRINPTNLKKFLSMQQSSELKQEPVVTSFSYFYSQAEMCFESFNKQSGNQQQFESRSQYNLFEWKCLRSLYRQRIQDILNYQKNPSKLQEHRLLNFLNKKQNELGEPKKKVKLDSDHNDN